MEKGDPLSIAFSLEGLALSLAMRDHGDDAARLLGADADDLVEERPQEGNEFLAFLGDQAVVPGAREGDEAPGFAGATVELK